MGSPDGTVISDGTTIRLFETPAAAHPSVISQLESAEFHMSIQVAMRKQILVSSTVQHEFMLVPVCFLC